MSPKKTRRRARAPSRHQQLGAGAPAAEPDAGKEEARRTRREEARRYRDSIRRKAIRRRYLRNAAYGLVAVVVIGAIVYGTTRTKHGATLSAQERTLLAWWRAGLAALAVALGVGRLVPALLDVSAMPFVILGIGYGILGISFVAVGGGRDRTLRRHLAAGGFEPLDGRVVLLLTVGLLLLGVATMGLLLFVS